MPTHTPVIFASSSDKMFVYLAPWPDDGELLFSPDGSVFYTLATHGFSGTSQNHRLSFDNPHDGTSGVLHRDNDTIDCGGERFVREEIPFDRSSVVPLPFARQSGYLCRFADGRLLYVSSDAYNFSYESFKLFVGDGKSMREIPIIKDSVMRMRDGGTTSFKTPEGSFYCPAPIIMERDPNRVPMWEQEELTMLDPNDFHITETPEGEVTITYIG